jgi:transketolase
MESLMPQTVKHAGPMYIRLGRGGDRVVSTGISRIGEARVLRQGRETIIFSTGTATQIALDAAPAIDATVVHVPTLKPLSLCHMSVSGKLRQIITVEDHSIVGGLGSAVAEVLAESGYQGKFRRIGYPDVFPHGYGTQDEMRARYGLTAEAIVQQVRGVSSAVIGTR